MKIKGFIIAGAILFITGICFCVGAYAKADFDKDNFNNEKNVTEYVEEYDTLSSVSVTNEVDIISVLYDSTISKPKLVYTESNLRDYTVNYDAGILTISQTYDASWQEKLVNIGINHDSYLKLYLPSTGLENLKVNTKYGGIKIDGVNITNLDLNVKNGAMSLKNISSEIANVYTKNGVIDISDSIINKMIAETKNGEIELDDLVVNEAIIECDNGSIEFNGSITKSLDANVDNGSLEIDLKESKTDCCVNGIGSGLIIINYAYDEGEVDITFGN